MDKIGNWQSTTGSLAGNSFNESRAHNDVHELTSISGSSVTLAYDDKGNMTTDANSNTLVWDIDNHLQSMVINGSSVTLAYDALGRRLEKSDGTNSTLFISDGQRVIEEYESAGGQPYSLARSYTYGTYVDDVIAKIEAVNTPTVLYYHSDRQFNVRGLTDTSGAIKELYAYSVYGQQTIVSSTGSNNNNYGFTGRYLDSETGLWYFRARYFSDELGRFISRDLLGYVDGMSLYGAYFASGFGVDPSGLLTDKDFEEVDKLDDQHGHKIAAVVEIQFKFDSINSENPKCTCVETDKCKKFYECSVKTKEVHGLDYTAKGKKLKGVKVVGALLKHENGHIKIADKHKKIIYDNMKASTGKGSNCGDLKKAVDNAFNDWDVNYNAAFDNGVKAHDTEQETYDIETKHGSDKDKQKKWDKKLK